MKKITLIICVFVFSANTLIAQLNFDNYVINPYSLVSTEGFNPSLVLYDFDNDGDEDILVYSGFSTLELYNNIGSATSPKFDSPLTSAFGLTNPQNIFPKHPALGDIDGDGDIDLLIGEQSGNFYLYKNTGTTGSPNYAAPALLNEYNLSGVALDSSPAFGDLDNDGDLDIMSGDRQGNLIYFVNTGTTPQTPNYTNNVTNPFNLVPPSNQGGYSNPVFIDMDSDGDLDLFCGYRYNFVYFENIGSASAPSFDAPVIGAAERRVGDTYFTPDFADLDNDGDMDLISGVYSQKILVHENLNLPETFTWNGASSTDWNVPSNWTSNTVPGAINRVIIPEIGGRFAKYPYISTSITIDRVELNSNARLDVSASGHLALNTLILEDTIYLSSGGGLEVKDTVRGSGLAQIVRVSTHDSGTGKYSIIGSPVRNQSTEALGSVVYSYDEQTAFGTDGSSRFQNISSPVTMQMGEGYFSAFTGTVLFHGVPEFSKINVNLVYNETNDGGSTNAGFNLVSNPYPSSVSHTAFASANADIDGTIYLWDDGGSDMSQRTNSDYITVTSLGATGGSSRSTDWDGFIRSAQGFFVKATTSGTLKFTPSMMTTGNNSDDGFFRKHSDTDQPLRLSLSSETGYNDILVGFTEDATEGFDRMLDAYKIKGNSNLQLYSKMGADIMAIQALPNPDQEVILALGFDALAAGNYTFTISDFQKDGFDVYLIDRQKDHVEHLSQSKKYTFETSSVVGSDRFSLLITPSNILSSASDVSKDELFIYSKADELTIRTTENIEFASIKIFNLSGQLVQNYPEVSFQKGSTTLDFKKAGLYILKMESRNGTFSQRFLK